MKKQDGTWTSGRKLKKRKCSHTLGRFLTIREVSQERKGTSEAQRREQKSVVAGRTERGLHGLSCHHTAFHPEMCVCWYLQGLGAGIRGLEDRPRNWCWLHRDSLKGMKCGTATTRGVFIRSLGPPQKQRAIVKWRMKGSEGPPLQALSPCINPCLHEFRRACPSCPFLWPSLTKPPPCWALTSQPPPQGLLPL